MRELDGLPEPAARVRAPGGGRKKLTESDPELMSELKALVDPQTRGDPMSPLRVDLRESTRRLAGGADRGGAIESATGTVARMLAAMAGYSLQANAKVIEGNQHPDRNAQFELHQRCVRRARFQPRRQPVISVDTKKGSWWEISRMAGKNCGPR